MVEHYIGRHVVLQRRPSAGMIRRAGRRAWAVLERIPVEVAGIHLLGQAWHGRVQLAGHPNTFGMARRAHRRAVPIPGVGSMRRCTLTSAQGPCCQGRCSCIQRSLRQAMAPSTCICTLECIGLGERTTQAMSLWHRRCVGLSGRAACPGLLRRLCVYRARGGGRSMWVHISYCVYFSRRALGPTRIAAPLRGQRAVCAWQKRRFQREFGLRRRRREAARMEVRGLPALRRLGASVMPLCACMHVRSRCSYLL